MTPNLIRARATINLTGLVCGKVAIVDPAVPYVKTCLDRGYLIPEADQQPRADDGRVGE